MRIGVYLPLAEGDDPLLLAEYESQMLPPVGTKLSVYLEKVDATKPHPRGIASFRVIEAELLVDNLFDALPGMEVHRVSESAERAELLVEPISDTAREYVAEVLAAED